MKRNSLFLFFAVLFWGFSYIAIKVCLAELTPIEMISVRFLLASPTLLLIMLAKGIKPWPVALKPRIAFSALIVFVHFWVMATGMKETSASNTAWILTTAPIFIALLGWVYLKETFSLPQWLGLAMAVLGVLALISKGQTENLTWIHSRGDLIVLCSCVTWAIYTVATREITERVDPLVATFWMVTLAALVFVPYTLATSGINKFMNLEWHTAVSLAFLGVCCLALAFWLWSEGLRHQPAAEVGVWLYIEPLFAVIGGWLLLHERLSIWLFIGAILISLGIYVSERYGRMRLVEHDA